MENQSTKMAMKEPITFGSMVNPGLLWVCYPSGVDENATIQKHKIDTDLHEHFSQRRNRSSAFSKDLQHHTRVVVQDTYETWMRGVIVGKKQHKEKEIFEVFLVDIGEIVSDLDADNIYLLPDKFSETPTQAFLIALYGIEPLGVEVDLSAGATVLVPSLNWGEYHWKFMSNVVAEADVALFKTKKVVNNVRHGVLFVDINKERWNVNEKLVELRLAIERNRPVDVSRYLVRNNHYELVKQFLGSSPQKENKLREATPSR